MVFSRFGHEKLVSDWRGYEVLRADVSAKTQAHIWWAILDHVIHPPVLGKFPRIRNVMCYLPIAWTDPTGIASADYLLGNEVVFDSLEDLNAALASDVRHELREDYKSFPPFYGTNSHYAMRRQRLYHR